MSQFAQKVFKLVKQIPKGKVTIYSSIANALHCKAYRAVGQVLKNNPNPIIIPCHRVICSNGKIVGYKLGIKKRVELLRKEGVEIKNNRVDLKKYLYEIKP